MGYLIDSNVLIDYIAGRFTVGQLYSLDLILDNELNISVINKIEILGFNIIDEEEIKMIEFLNNANIIQLTEDIVNATIALKKAIKIKTPDAIIASTALVNGHTLVTNNMADFKRIADLKILNLYDL